MVLRYTKKILKLSITNIFNKENQMKAADFLSQVSLIVRERGEVYGDPRANLGDTAARWSATLGHKVTPAQVCLCMVDLKISRLKASPQHIDSLQDIAGYIALLSEIITD
jgi:hypothetical protein